MEILPKIILSIIILVLAVVIYFLPEHVISVSNSSFTSQNNEVSFIGDNNNTINDFGNIDTEENKARGYGYIKSKAKNKESFGTIEFDNKLNDSLFIKRVKLKFNSNNIKFYNNSGIAYALVDGKQIYIENTNITQIIGFNDVINLALIINLEGNIDSVIYLSSNETQSYINTIIRSGYFNQYSNLPSNKAAVIDAVSGATITSVATAKAVNEIYKLAEDEILSDYLTGNYTDFSITAQLNKIWILNLGILILLFAILLFKRFRKRKIFTAISLFTVVWLGFYLNASFTYLLFIKAFTVSSLSIFSITYILMVLASTVWTKNTYCKHICPFGNAQKLMFKISPFKKSKAIFKNKQLKLIRYSISIIVIIGYLSGIEILSEYELFPYFFSVNTSYLIFGISVLVMLISMRIPNLWCRALCPTGCVLDTISDVSDNKLFTTKAIKS